MGNLRVIQRENDKPLTEFQHLTACLLLLPIAKLMCCWRLPHVMYHAFQPHRLVTQGFGYAVGLGASPADRGRFLQAISYLRTQIRQELFLNR